MKLLVFSDSHGNLAHMVDAVEREAPDLVLHLGDCWRDGEELGYACPGLPLEQVPGNCDFHPGAAQERLLRLEGHTLFVCHGHTLGVKQGCGGAIRAAQAQGADLLLFGHTHRADSGEADGLFWMNPGSVGLGSPPSYGVVLLGPEGKMECLHRRLDLL